MRPPLLPFALLALLAACERPPVAPARPNVVLVSLDTLRADHLGLYGYARDTSPHLDALARESVVFELAIAQAASTPPSHRSLFQSRYASHTDPMAPELAEVLAGAGYRTVAFAGGGYLSKELGFGRGFERWEEKGRSFAQSFPAFESWLRTERAEPFFAFLHSYDVHLPYDPPPPLDRLFLPEYDGPVTGPATLEICRKIRRLFEYASFEGEVQLTDADRRKIVALYDGAIRHADGYVGRLMALLRELGLWERTVLVVFSDHGEEFWDHGSVLHSHTVYQELIRVPLLWRVPSDGIRPRRVKELVRNMDVAPTILDLLGVPAPPTFRGTSLVPVLGGAPVPALPGVSEMEQHKAWITPPWKLIVAPPRARQLFDLAADPREQRDLAAAQPDRVREMEAALMRALGDKTDAPVPEGQRDAISPALEKQLRALGYLDDQ